MKYKALIVLMVFLGIMLLVVDVVRINTGLYRKKPRVIYRYIPRTFEEEQEDPLMVSDVFETMFSQPSPWIVSIRNYERRKQEKVNQYFVNQL